MNLKHVELILEINMYSYRDRDPVQNIAKYSTILTQLLYRRNHLIPTCTSNTYFEELYLKCNLMIIC